MTMIQCPNCGSQFRRRGGFLSGCFFSLIVLLVLMGGVLWWLDIEIPFYPFSRTEPRVASSPESTNPAISDATSETGTADNAEAVQMNITGDVRVTGQQIQIQNKDSFDWTNVTVTLNSTDTDVGYRHTLENVPAGQTVAVDLSQFQNPEGQSFNPAENSVSACYLNCDTPNGNGVYSRQWSQTP